MARSIANALSPLLLLACLGCGPGSLPGHYWDLDMSLASDGCNDPDVGFSDSFTYRLLIDVQEIEVGIGRDVFASGTIDGCSVEYTSVIWTDLRDEGVIRWQLQGEGLAQRGDGACGIQADWQGTETFVVISSDDPTISPGCEYTMNVTGTYAGEVE